VETPQEGLPVTRSLAGKESFEGTGPFGLRQSHSLQQASI